MFSSAIPRTNQCFGYLQYYNRVTGTSQWHRPSDATESNKTSRNEILRTIDIVSTSSASDKALHEPNRVAVALEIARLEKELKDANQKIINLNSLLQV